MLAGSDSNKDIQRDCLRQMSGNKTSWLKMTHTCFAPCWCFFWFWIRERKPVSVRHPSCMQCVWLTTRLRHPNQSKGSTRPETWLIVDYANRSTSEWISFALILFVCLCLPSLLFPLRPKLLLFVYRSCVISLSPPNTPAAWSLHYSFYLWLGILLKK